MHIHHFSLFWIVTSKKLRQITIVSLETNARIQTKITLMTLNCSPELYYTYK